MTAATHSTGSLALTAIAHSAHSSRWQTEAMRSYSTPRLLYIGRGHGRITIAGSTRGYGPNNLIFIPAQTMHGFDVGPTVFGQMLTIPAAMAAEWPDAPTHLRLRDVTAQKELVAHFDGLEKELRIATGVHSRAAHYHLGLLSVFFSRQQDAQSQTETPKITSAARLVAAYTDLIENNFRSDAGVSDYAKTLGVTSTHLTRCCKQTSGRAALELLRDRRHFEACKLLRGSKTPIQDIAAALGYSSPAYFSRAFTSQSGQSPRHFRSQGKTKQ